MGASLGTERSRQPGSHLKSNLTSDVTVSELINLAEKHTCQPVCLSDRLSVSLGRDSNSRLAEVPGRSGGGRGVPRTPLVLAEQCCHYNHAHSELFQLHSERGVF